MRLGGRWSTYEHSGAHCIMTSLSQRGRFIIEGTEVWVTESVVRDGGKVYPCGREPLMVSDLRDGNVLQSKVSMYRMVRCSTEGRTKRGSGE